MRAFIAIEIPQAVRDAMTQAQQQLPPSKNRISWVKTDNVHLTLKFLGEILDEQLPQINSGLIEAVMPLRAFNITVKGAGAFPSTAAPRVIWVGCESKEEDVFVPATNKAAAATPKALVEGPSQLLELVRAVNEMMEKCGFAPDTDQFKPHLTLGRIKFPKPDPALTSALESLKTKTFGTVPVNEIHLLQSDLNAEAPIYTRLASHALRKT